MRTHPLSLALVLAAASRAFAEEAPAPVEAPSAPADATPAPAAQEVPKATPAAPSTAASRVVLLGGDNPSETPTAPRGENWNAWVWARARAASFSPFALDRNGYANPLEKTISTRLRLGGVYAPIESLSVTLEGDVLAGQAAGDRSELGSQAGRLDDALREGAPFEPFPGELRQAYVSWRTPVGELRGGRMSFRWGLGMIANDGRGEPDFGDRRRGDLIDRLVFATKPFSKISSDSWAQTTVFLGLDSIARDENADRSRGDEAYQAIGGFRWEGERASLGGLVALRGQTDRVEAGERDRRATLHAMMTDVTGKWVAWNGDEGARFTLEGELAAVRGRTTRTLFEATNADGATVETAGAVARGTLEMPSWLVTARGEVGHATGDRDPYDATVRTFSFDPDYKVGLLLFDPVVRRVLARAMDRAADPEIVRVPQAGLRFLDTQGSVTNATYGNVVVRVRPGAGFDLRAGFLVARTPEGILDPYESAANGGYGVDGKGRPAGPAGLGKELDGAVRYTLPLEGVTARLLIDGAVLFPGASLFVTGESAITLARAGVDVAW